MVAYMGIGDAYGIEGAGADDLFRRRGHDDDETRRVFSGVSTRTRKPNKTSKESLFFER